MRSVEEAVHLINEQESGHIDYILTDVVDADNYLMDMVKSAGAFSSASTCFEDGSRL